MILAPGLIVSCQARADNPLHGAVFMGAMAQAAAQGGAVAIRANGAEDVAACKAAGLPVIGIAKRHRDDYPVYITPDLADAAPLVAAGARLVALDATDRPRDGLPLAELIPAVKALGVAVFADVDTLEAGRRAADLGADYVATTLSGYTDRTAHLKAQGPDLALVEALAGAVRVPVIAEGRFDTPERVRAARDAGAHAVVVGTAITNPREITRRFAGAMA
ncbi:MULTISPECIES: putative N-acetylmannosamine-6-phosphate 2-epimerase [unclassified Roseitalea]|uniref:N-acetylmannosamine-6-phosphate 2-epimerase n=1 Tax=unclassified Roseitalea TaxID=2639107 RepID=UPI00273D09D8|nr:MULTISPECIES: putative N-acetylmannosamine-6-phosphate 2-epimerase [unclassified Roseitalea]